MMIEDFLLNYGVLGAWTITLLVERYRNRNVLKKVIENNTIAITRVYEVIKKCRKV